MNTQKYDKTIALLENCVQFFKNVNASNSNSSLLLELADMLKLASKKELDIIKIIKDYDKEKIVKPKIVQFTDEEKIQISDFIKGKNISDEIKTKSEIFFTQYKNLIDIFDESHLIKQEIFDKIQFDDWKTDELKFILVHSFGSTPKNIKNKKEYYEMIKSYLYQNGYFKGVSEKYSEKNKKS